MNFAKLLVNRCFSLELPVYAIKNFECGYIVLEIPVTTNGCEFCEDSLYLRACVGTPNAMVQSII